MFFYFTSIPFRCLSMSPCPDPMWGLVRECIRFFLLLLLLLDFLNPLRGCVRVLVDFYQIIIYSLSGCGPELECWGKSAPASAGCELKTLRDVAVAESHILVGTPCDISAYCIPISSHSWWGGPSYLSSKCILASSPSPRSLGLTVHLYLSSARASLAPLLKRIAADPPIRISWWLISNDGFPFKPSRRFFSPRPLGALF